MNQDLIERLEKAEVGSRELDAEVAEATVGFFEWDGSSVTTDLNAAIALVEREIPGVWWHVAKGKTRSDEPEYGAVLLFGSDESVGAGEGFTSPLAVCAALLRAHREGEGR